MQKFVMGQKFVDYIHYLKADENAYKKKKTSESEKQCESHVIKNV